MRKLCICIAAIQFVFFKVGLLRHAKTVNLRCGYSVFCFLGFIFILGFESFEVWVEGVPGA